LDPDVKGPFHLEPRDPNLPIVFPIRTVAVLAVVVPIVIGAVTMLGSAVALRVRPFRVSTMTFE
jgi:hypothetical protein